MNDFDQFLVECRSGNLQKIDDFLRNEAILRKVRADGAINNDALRNSVESGNLNVVKRLLKIPEVLAGATALNNYALNRAMELEHLYVVSRLLRINKVFNVFIQNLNDNLSNIGSLEMLCHLLQSPKVLKAIELKIQNGEIKIDDKFIIEAIDAAKNNIKNIGLISKVLHGSLPQPIAKKIEHNLDPKNHEPKAADVQNDDLTDKNTMRSQKRPKD